MYLDLIYSSGMEKKILGSIRLTKEAWRLLRLLAAHSGVSMTAIMEMAIRDRASREGMHEKEDLHGNRRES
jgi:hypothetical protein